MKKILSFFIASGMITLTFVASLQVTYGMEYSSQYGDQSSPSPGLVPSGLRLSNARELEIIGLNTYQPLTIQEQEMPIMPKDMLLKTEGNSVVGIPCGHLLRTFITGSSYVHMVGKAVPPLHAIITALMYQMQPVAADYDSISHAQSAVMEKIGQGILKVGAICGAGIAIIRFGEAVLPYMPRIGRALADIDKMARKHGVNSEDVGMLVLLTMSYNNVCFEQMIGDYYIPLPPTSVFDLHETTWCDWLGRLVYMAWLTIPVRVIGRHLFG